MSPNNFLKTEAVHSGIVRCMYSLKAYDGTTCIIASFSIELFRKLPGVVLNEAAKLIFDQCRWILEYLKLNLTQCFCGIKKVSRAVTNGLIGVSNHLMRKHGASWLQDKTCSFRPVVFERRLTFEEPKCCRSEVSTTEGF